MRFLIRDFKHNEYRITFTVADDNGQHHVEVVDTNFGAEFTAIEDFTEEYSDREFESLERFVDGCSDIVRFHDGSDSI